MAVQPAIQPTRQALGEVDPVQPLDPTSPLARGLEGFWLPLPSTSGGSRLYDLSPYKHNGNSQGSGSEYFGVLSKYPFPVVRLNTSNSQWFDVSSVESRIQGSDEITIAIGVKANATGIDSSMVGHADGFDDGTGMRYDSSGFSGGGSSVIKAAIHSTSGLSNGESESNTQTTNRQDLLLTWKSGNAPELYIDGSLDSWSAAPPSLGGSIETSNMAPFGVGRGLFPDEGTWDGDILYTMVLSEYTKEAQARRIYHQARRGFPSLLNRRDESSLYVTTGGSGTADTVSVGTGTALAEGFAPSVTATPNTIAAGTAQAAAQGYDPSITATQNTIAAGTAQATAQGYDPTITASDNTVAATTGQAAAQGYDPTISEGAAGDTLVAGLGTAQASGFEPSISTNPATVTLGLGTAPAQGFDPGVDADPSVVNAGQGQAPASGFDPTVTTNARTVAPQLGQAPAEGFEPNVIDGTVGKATTMEIEARPKYEIELEARPLYRIRLFVREQLP